MTELRHLVQEPEPERSEGLWDDLDNACEAAFGISQHLSTHLEKEASADECVTLLQRQLDLAETIRAGIGRLRVQRDSGRTWAADGTRTKLLVGRLKELLDLEQHNYDLMTRNGMRLKGPLHRIG